MEPICSGTHHFYAAETGAVEDSGKVFIVLICTNCGESKLIEHTVAGGQSGQKVRMDPKHGGR